MSKLYTLLNSMITKLNVCVKTTTQTLTSTQKSQARANIGAMADSYTAPVASVNKKTGEVTLSAADVGAVPTGKQMTMIGIDASGVEHVYTIYGEEDPDAPV